MAEKEDKLTISTVRMMGFTDSLIKKLLPEPEEATNPFYKSAPPMKLFRKNDVEAAMQTEEFLQAQEKRKARSASTKKAAETKRNKLRQEFAQKKSQISVQKIPLNELQELAIRDRQDWYNYQATMRSSCDFRDARSADMETVFRWMVNFARHNLTEYDESLYDLKGRVGKFEVYGDYRAAVLDKIAETYPELADECEKQKRVW